MVTQDLDDLLKEENYVERVFKVILDSKNLSHSDQVLYTIIQLILILNNNDNNNNN